MTPLLYATSSLTAHAVTYQTIISITARASGGSRKTHPVGWGTIGKDPWNLFRLCPSAAEWVHIICVPQEFVLHFT